MTCSSLAPTRLPKCYLIARISYLRMSTVSWLSHSLRISHIRVGYATSNSRREAGSNKEEEAAAMAEEEEEEEAATAMGEERRKKGEVGELQSA